MNIFTRRLVTLAATCALVSGPALTVVDSGAAQAAPLSAGSVAAPAGLLDGVGDVISGLLGAVTGGTTAATDPQQLLTTIVTAVTSVPGSELSADALTQQLTDVLTSGDDPATTLTSVIETLTDGTDTGNLESAVSQLTPTQVGAIVGTLTSALPISSVFPGGTIPEPIAALLSGGTAPSTDRPTADLISALTDFYTSQGTQPDDQVKSALPSSLLQLLLASLAGAPSQQPTHKPTTQPVTHVAAPAAHPSSRCRTTTAKVRSLKKKLKAAKKHHHSSRAKALTKKLKRAKRAKRNAC